MLGKTREKTIKQDSKPKAAGVKLLTAGNTTSTGFNPTWHNLALQVTGVANTTGSLVQRFSTEHEQEPVNLKSLGVQGKLTVGAPNDAYEQEADRVADQVMGMPQFGTQSLYGEEQEAPPIQSKALNISPIQHLCGNCEKEKTTQSKQANGTQAVPTETTAKIKSLGGYKYLPESTRNYFEPRFASDFSQVRVHDGAQAAETARAINARAFTRGHDIVFGSGEYRPQTGEGRKLIAHELTHVVQQKGKNLPIQRKYTLPELRQKLTRRGKSTRSFQVSTSPAVYFYSGSSANTHNRRAFVMAGIHGDEQQAKQLGRRVRSDLSSSGGPRPYFHTLVAPQLNPGTGRHVSVNRGGRSIDPNRSFGGTPPVAHPIVSTVTEIEKDFQPERALSVHAIRMPNAAERRRPLGGIYLDPLWWSQKSPPSLKTTPEKAAAFTQQSHNLSGMKLTERMIDSVRKEGGKKGRWATSGNIPGRKRGVQFPANRFPGTGEGTSQYNLLYPMQSKITKTSFGVLASGLKWSRAIITMEIPGLKGSVWSKFLPAVWEFLQVTRPAASSTPSTGSSGQASASSHPSISPKKNDASEETVQRAPITEANLPSPTARDISKPERRRRTFMREVYRRQVAIWTASGDTYVHEIAPSDRTTLPGSYVKPGRTVSIHTSIAGSVQDMLDAARSDLAGANIPGGSAADIEALAVRSGYRSATKQFGIWQRYAPRQYYDETRAHRSTLPGGEHGAEAAQYLAEYTNQRVFSPGYSPHQRATAIDLTYKYRSGREPAGTDKGWAPASSRPVWINTWRRSWFFSWLWQNAPRYGFMRNPDINEPWHWEFRPTPALVMRFIRWLLNFLDRFFNTHWSARFEESFSGGQGPLGPGGENK
ncbi:DUF4157 domain-containing protein [Desulfogranum marinum]|uniref:eCIS core domain-containing protein n=1 Tax=Desulfogranum marinum TaxID=453220 RepID=UPI0029C76825|nr:DUF4157 domain-containing protein [Desulfogranum marinum]